MRAGFTLIELLVVVAIIAILAAIAAPNYLESQSRAKVSREMTDMRSIASALESYGADYSAYPPHGEILANGTVAYPATAGGISTVEFPPGYPLTTPVAYISTIPEDVCMRAPRIPVERRYGYINTRQMANIFRARGWNAQADALEPRNGGWRLYAAAPDGDKGPDTKLTIPYDPTNGTVSNGDLVRSQRNPQDQQNQDEQ